MQSTDASFYKELLRHIRDGVYYVDRDRRIQYWNDGASRLTGYKAEELVGRFCPDHGTCHLDEPGAGMGGCQDRCPLTASVDDGEAHEIQWFLQHKQGRRVPVVLRTQPILSPDGSIVGAVAIFSDDSVHQAALRKSEELERLAFLDEVTRLPNRRYMEMCLRTALDQFHTHNDPFGVLVIDVDKFKTINDDFGHAVGDLALKEVAKVVSQELRGMDVIGRWGGDEFVAVVYHVNADILRGLAERCCGMAAKTSVPTGVDSAAFLSVSIGGTIARPVDLAGGLVARADALMYRCKARGRGLLLIDEPSRAARA